VPVVLTLVSRPVIAGGSPGACTSASAYGSINASRPGGTPICSGRTPGYWKNYGKHPWPAPYEASGSSPSKFDDVFGSGYPNKTLLDVLEQGGGGKNAVARYIVAALLNAANSLTPPTVLDASKVKLIWQDFVNDGVYSPTAGVTWNASDLVDWLKTTMPV
jgi:hypothetical protein